MTFSIDMAALLERASKRAAQHGYQATPATRLPEPTAEPAAEGSQVATVARYPAPEQGKTNSGATCTNCQHLSHVKTCTEPVAAGLLSTFGIVWPEPSHGATCPAWRRHPADAVVAVLTAAGRGGWSDTLMHKWLADAAENPEAVLDVLRELAPASGRRPISQ